MQRQPERPTSASAAPGAAAEAAVSAGDELLSRPAFEAVPEDALERAIRLSRGVDHPLLKRVLEARPGPEFQALNNALMDTYRVHGSLEAFSLLFELNTRPFTVIANRILRMTGSRADIGDILQETFLAIYRYPSRFCPDKPCAFRNWSYSIIRNTVYRHLQLAAREGIPVDFVTEILPDERVGTPSAASEEAESDQQCERVYGLLLCLYMEIYERDLKPRDRLALQLVEVDRLGYREAAQKLGIRLENFKMIVCRARKKIFQSLVRTLGTRPS